MISNKKEILVSAYAISPYLGSEYGVGWNFVSKLSDFYNITVLYGTSGGEMGNNSGIIDYLKKNEKININFVFVKPNKLVNFFDFLNHKVSPLFFTIAYYLWQIQVFGVAKKLISQKKFQLIHQLNTIGFRQPGFLWKLGIPFVWGPVGGSSNLDKIFMGSLSKGNLIKNIIRNITNLYFLKFSSRIKSTVKAAAAIFVATTADQMNFIKYFKIELPVIRENSIIKYATEIKKINEVIVFVWVGSLDERKALNFLLEALSRLRTTKPWVLNVVGDGPIRRHLYNLSVNFGINNNIIWHGNVSHDSVISIMKKSDINIITSIMDSNPTVLLEAFEVGIPTIALDHFGMKDLIDDHVGFKISITNINEIIHTLALTLTSCIENHQYVELLKNNIIKRQKELHWDKSIKKVCDIYEKVIIND